jgi:choline dehydrogenase
MTTHGSNTHLTYDYVIVGAGSAGCVLANRLTEDPDTTVLLLEAGGPDTSDLVHMPAGCGSLLRGPEDWDHTTVWEPHINNRHICLPRGKVLGGSSSTNWMVYMRGHRSDYDQWRDDGCEGWEHDELLPYFKRAEDNERGASEYHGAGGPLSVSDARWRTPLVQAWIDAGLEHGLAANDDFNGAEQDGIGRNQVTCRDGRRCSTAVAYLHPVADRPNLTIETYQQAARIMFDSTRAVGVVTLQLGRPFQWRAEREVIVCGGAYGSPQLLMLSGLGRPDELAALGIAPVAEVPDVGRNLEDHPVAGAAWAVRTHDSLFGALTPENLARFADGQGPLTSNLNEGSAFVRTRERLPAPDIQLALVNAVGDGPPDSLLPPSEHAMGAVACLLKPRSRGYVALGSPDPLAKPLILHNYLEHPDDVRSMVAGLRLVIELADRAPVSKLVHAMRHGPASTSDADLEAHVRATMQTTYHPTSTCRMGADQRSVVDPQLRVRGVEALRIVDASIMPSVPRGNTNAPTIAIAEKAADLIRGRATSNDDPIATKQPSAAIA